GTQARASSDHYRCSRRLRIRGAVGAGRPPDRRGSSARPPDGLDELRLSHAATPFDVELAGLVVELVAGSLLERAVGVARTLGAPRRRAPLLSALLVDRARRDLLGPLLSTPALLRAVLDVLVLALVLAAPLLRHREPSSPARSLAASGLTPADRHATRR